ncbi:DUF4157 domain-containing protein [Kordia sp.]|uniref:eCIS core domain-containing protein n=1 Tax=Kordia sp. TaxID=1965332 RepID=UPI003D6B561B
MKTHLTKKSGEKNQQKAAAHQSKSVALEDNRPMPIIQQKKNNTGLPDNLKSGMESMSGHSLDDVKVHYNSSKPAQLNAHAYAQGSNIHLASGQEKHLAHEAWHVVQQKQGRVQPTTTISGTKVNDDVGLEKEADAMGAKALQRKTKTTATISSVNKPSTIIQRAKHIGQYLAKEDGNVRNAAHSKIGTYKKGDAIEINSSHMKKFTSGILFGKKEHVYGTVNGATGWIVENNIGGWQGHLAAPAHVNGPAKLWTNQPSRFTSFNTSNNKGNSMYTVTAHDLYRYAPVNKDPSRHALDQVYHDSKNRHVAFTSDGAALAKLHDPVFRTGPVTYVGGHLIADDGTKRISIAVQLAPALGLTVIDFNYDPVTRSISGRHVGHAVASLK